MGWVFSQQFCVTKPGSEVFSFCPKPAAPVRPRGRQSGTIIIWPTGPATWTIGAQACPLSSHTPRSTIPPTPLYPSSCSCQLLRSRTLNGKFIHSCAGQGTTGVNFHNFPSANMNFHHLRVPTGRAGAAQRGATFSMWCMSGGRAGPTAHCRYRSSSSDSFPGMASPSPGSRLTCSNRQPGWSPSRNLCNTPRLSQAAFHSQTS